MVPSSLAKSFLKVSMPSPFFPITIPGLAENIFIVTFSELLSISILLIAASFNLAFSSFLIIKSEFTFFGN